MKPRVPLRLFSPIFAVFLLCSILQADHVFAQPLTSYPQDSLRGAAIGYMKNLNAGRFKFLLLEVHLATDWFERDTITVAFARDVADGDKLRFVAEDSKISYVYRDEQLARISWIDSTIEQDSLGEKQALSRSSEWLSPFFSLLTRGKHLEETLAVPGANYYIGDTTIGEDSLFQIAIIVDSTNGIGTYHSDTHYLFGKDSVYRGVTQSLEKNHLPFRYGAFMLSWSFGDKQIPLVDKKIDRVLQRVLQADLHEISRLRDTTFDDAKAKRILDALQSTGDTAPEIIGTTMDGHLLNVSQEHHKLYLLDFWDAACPYCYPFGDVLNKLSREFSDRGLFVVGLNSSNPLTVIDKMARHAELGYLQLSIPRETEIAYGVPGHPTAYLLDDRFRIVKAIFGSSPQLEQQLREEIVKYLH